MSDICYVSPSSKQARYTPNFIDCYKQIECDKLV